MGLLGGLFGGGGGGGDVNQTTTAVPWGPSQPHYERIMSEAGRLYDQGGPGYYPGQTFAGRDPLSDQAQNLRLNYATNSMPGQVYDAQRAQSFALNSPDVANNPYVQNMMESNQFLANRNLAENILPQMKLGAMASGQVGSSRHRGIAEGLAARGTNEAVANANAKTMYDAYNRGLGAQQGALSMAPGIMNMGMAPMDVMSGVGSYNTAIDQQALDADMQRYGFNQERPWDAANRYSGLVGGSSRWGSSSESDGGGSSPVAGAIGGGLLGASAASMPYFGAGGGGAALGTAMGGWALPLIGAGVGLFS